MREKALYEEMCQLPSGPAINHLKNNNTSHIPELPANDSLSYHVQVGHTNAQEEKHLVFVTCKKNILEAEEVMDDILLNLDMNYR